MKDIGGGHEFNYDVYCKDFGKCAVVPPVQQQQQ
jgi:hypothetical protein